MKYTRVVTPSELVHEADAADPSGSVSGSSVQLTCVSPGQLPPRLSECLLSNELAVCWMVNVEDGATSAKNIFSLPAPHWVKVFSPSDVLPEYGLVSTPKLSELAHEYGKH